MKAVKIDLAGQAYYLAFNGAAMFAFEDVFSGTAGYFEQSAGAGREVESEEDVDLCLIELEQKNNRLTRAHYLRMGSALGYGARETMLMRPGLVFDMWELMTRGRKQREEPD